MRKHFSVIVGTIVIVTMIVLFNGPMIRLSEWFLFATPRKMFLRDLIYFGVFFILGLALALFIVDKRRQGFRIKKVQLCIGSLVLLYYFIMFLMYYLSFVVGIIEVSYGKLNFFQIFFAKTSSYYAAYPRIYMTTLCGFLVTHGLYGNKDE